MNYQSVCTNQYHPTVHLYLYPYLHLYVQCCVVPVIVAPLRKKETREVFLTWPPGARRRLIPEIPNLNDGKGYTGQAMREIKAKWRPASNRIV